jgi:hypothetical protein
MISIGVRCDVAGMTAADMGSPAAGTAAASWPDRSSINVVSSRVSAFHPTLMRLFSVDYVAILALTMSRDTTLRSI